MDNQKLQQIQKELAELKNRAYKANYKNVIPSLPKMKHKSNIDSTFQGFYKRLNNWKNGLVQLENYESRPKKDNLSFDVLNGNIIHSV